MRVLVTGATGYLGRAIVDACREAGHEVVAFARRASSSGLTGTLVDGDVRDGDAVRHALRGCQAVVHAAALVSVWRQDRREFDDVNVGGLKNVLEAAQSLGVERVAYTSSFLALPPAGASTPGAWNDYQRTKVAAEREAAAAVSRGVPVIRLYPGVIYGPGAATEGNLVGRQVVDHLSGRLPGVIGADRTWSFAYVVDVARAHVAALERGVPGGRYEVGGENLPQMTVFEILRDRLGCSLPRRLPAALGRVAGAIEEARARLTGRTPLLTRGTVEILVRDWPLDSSAAQRDLGYAITPLAAGLDQVLISQPVRELVERRRW